ncbi:hypothetical protein ACKWTF_015729 [Chironomus riparius]
MPMYRGTKKACSHSLTFFQGIKDGTRLAIAGNCNAFTLCDSGIGLNLTCRLSEPHFDPCLKVCSSDMNVCSKTCSDDTTTIASTTTTTTTKAEDPTTTTTTTSTTTTTKAPVTTTTTTKAPVTTTTTKFAVPTVPIGCTPSCSKTFNTTVCECTEKWVCVNQVCTCDATKACPVDRATCEGTGTGGCGCVERCDCTGTAPDEKCFCIENVVCPFNKADCADICDCEEQCDDTVCKEDPAEAGTFICTACNKAAQCSFANTECASKCGCANNCNCTTDTSCTCNPICACIEPPVVCPFKPSDCVARCGCDKRCEATCNGDFCVCDPAVKCT